MLILIGSSLSDLSHHDRHTVRTLGWKFGARVVSCRVVGLLFRLVITRRERILDFHFIPCFYCRAAPLSVSVHRGSMGGLDIHLHFHANANVMMIIPWGLGRIRWDGLGLGLELELKLELEFDLGLRF